MELSKRAAYGSGLVVLLFSKNFQQPALEPV